MMRSQQTFFYFCIIITAFLGAITFVTPCTGGSTVTLDKESVFCLYYKLSGDIMSDQDIEDLCAALGKPTFSNYKPSELFTKNTIHKSRNALLEKMKLLNETSVFKWDVTCTCIGKRGNTDLDFGRSLPQPTPFITAKISPKGQVLINTRLAQAINALNPEKSTTLMMSVYLKPQQTDNRFEDRNIGRQNVFFPLRSVVFQPGKIIITFKKNTRNLLASHNNK